jgi:hypothetical protein
MWALLEAGVEGDIWHAIGAMQEGLRCRVRNGHKLSAFFELLYGILEGACSSPPRHSIFAEALATALRATKLGLSITLAGGEVVWLGMLGFVDDKCLLSTRFSEMQDMLDVAATVSRTQRSVYIRCRSSLVLDSVCRFPQLEAGEDCPHIEGGARRACDCGRAGGDAAS